jgi:hypothetical protein
MVTKASGSTLLIIGTAMVAGGYVLLESTDGNRGTVIGMILMGVGGITIYKGIEVLIFSGRGGHEYRGHGGLKLALKVSF